jgi:alkylated DNA repair dioxygenase AlkB
MDLATMETFDLFDNASSVPEGCRYDRGLIDQEQERELIATMEGMRFSPFQFHGFEGKRRVVSFGWRYDFNGAGLQTADDIPPFLLPLRQSVATRFALPASALQQALLTFYPAGATIGWHKDRSVFQDIVGISLLSPCTFRFRRKAAEGWERRSLTLEPRSAYLLQGQARSEWEHSIPAVPAKRYSITFRSLWNRETKNGTQ